MDAADVAPAWALMEQGVASEDPKIKETQERLGACMYTMSHPETGQLVPACVQHSVLDPGENIGLRKMFLRCIYISIRSTIYAIVVIVTSKIFRNGFCICNIQLCRKRANV